MSAITDRLKSKKGIAVIIALVAGIAYVVFGYTIDPTLLETATDAISGVTE